MSKKYSVCLFLALALMSINRSAFPQVNEEEMFGLISLASGISEIKTYEEAKAEAYVLIDNFGKIELAHVEEVKKLKAFAESAGKNGLNSLKELIEIAIDNKEREFNLSSEVTKARQANLLKLFSAPETGLGVVGTALNIKDVIDQLLAFKKELLGTGRVSIKTTFKLAEKIAAFNPIAGATIYAKDEIDRALDMARGLGDQYRDILYRISDEYYRQFNILKDLALEGRDPKERINRFLTRRLDMALDLNNLLLDLNSPLIQFVGKSELIDQINKFINILTAKETTEKQRIFYETLYARLEGHRVAKLEAEHLAISNEKVINRIIANLDSKITSVSFDYAKDNGGLGSDKAIKDAIGDKKIDDTKSIETARKVELDRQLARFDVDIFFLADNTGSMGGLINSAKTNAQAILDALRADARFSKVNVQFGVGMFLGDPSEAGETATTAYQLLQPVTNSDADITAAINQWYASGGGDWEEANFYAIQQVITSGGSVPRNASLKSNQATGWRSGAAKVIVVFGDAPSWQNSVNEKELKDLVRATGAKVVFIDTSEINVGQQSNVYAAASGRQMQDAALEIADASGGSYMQLSDVSKIKDAVLDSVYDAIADNKWGGGMLARIDAGTHWRTRTPSSVVAKSTDGGKTLNFTLQYPNQPDATFSVDTTAAGMVAGHEYYKGTITGASNIFGKNMNADSVFHVNAAQDFYRFVLRGDGGVVEGYYGERLNSSSKLPASGVSTYDLRHRIISPYGINAYAAGGMKLFANWSSGKVYGFESNAALAGGTGTALFIGAIDRSALEMDGQYVFKPRRLTTAENSSIPRFIRDAMRETTSLQFYGNAYPNGVGGTFGSTFYNEAGSPTLSSMLMSGYVNEKTVTKHYSPSNNEVWKGYAVGLIANRSTGAVTVAYNTNPDDTQMTLRSASATAKADITVRDGGTAYSFGTDWTDTSVYVNKDAFAAIKDVNGVPSYAATTMTEDDGYNYLSWGVWSTELVATPNISVMDGSHWIAGTLTPTTSMPTTGTATYTGQIRGTAHEGGALHALNGSCNLTANFGTGNISGQLNIQYANTGASYATSNLSGVSITGNQFGGSLSGADNAGAISGGFFGPAAQEVGGNWAIEKTSGSKAAGVFSGKK